MGNDHPHAGGFGIMLLGPTFHVPCALAACPTNAANALIMRHLSLAPYQTKLKLYNPFLTVIRQALKLEYDLAYAGELQVDWMERKNQIKQNMIRQSLAYDFLKVNRAKSFVKKECNTKVPTKARLIQGHMNDATAYEHAGEYYAFASALKKMADVPFEIDGITFQLIYASGLNHDEISDKFTEAVEPNSLYDERDGKNWDSTMNETLLRAEIAVYEMLGMLAAKHTTERASHTKGSIYFKLFKTIKYVTAWKRLSGDWNTSSGNSIISMIICVTVILMLPPHLRPKNVVAFFMGDDYLARYKYNIVPCATELHTALDELERSCGITPERGIFANPLDVTFISLMVWPRHGGGYQFVPKPAKQLSKLFATVKFVPPRMRQEVINGIVIAMSYAFRGFEFMERILQSQFRGGKVCAREYLDRKFWSLTRVDRRVHWEHGFYHHYQHLIQSLPIFTPQLAIYNHPIVDHMLTVEGRDPGDRPTCK